MESKLGICSGQPALPLATFFVQLFFHKLWSLLYHPMNIPIASLCHGSRLFRDGEYMNSYTQFQYFQRHGKAKNRSQDDLYLPVNKLNVIGN